MKEIKTCVNPRCVGFLREQYLGCYYRCPFCDGPLMSLEVIENGDEKNTN